GIPYFHLDVFKRYFSMFRDACEAEGYQADPLQAGWLVPIYVAETDAQARGEYEEHLWYFVKRLLPGITIQPPGYTSVRSLGSILKSAGTFMLNLETWDQVVDGRYAIVGSPETVTNLLVDSLRQLGTGNLLGLFQLGSLPADLTRRNMALFAEEVMPRLREEFPEGKPVHQPGQAAA
ncbi:MAG: LLM class flavin-dependent oxidoreductase, partial [Acidimicrobiia bacterium]